MDPERFQEVDPYSSKFLETELAMEHEMLKLERM